VARPLVLVTGAPASGKSTIARPLAEALGLPLLDKDAVKEALFDALGTGDREWSRRLSDASYAVLFAMLEGVRSAVMVANLAPERARPLRGFDGPILEIFCTAPAHEIERRLRERVGRRHPGHLDEAILREWLDRPLAPAPVGLGPVMTVDTSAPGARGRAESWLLSRPEHEIDYVHLGGNAEMMAVDDDDKGVRTRRS
jgi:predicted kinase